MKIPEVAWEKVAITVLAAVALVLLLREAREILIPIVLSVLLSYALSPVVARAVRWRIPRGVASAALMLLIAGLLGWTSYTLSDDLAAVIRELPRAAKYIRQSLQDARNGPDALGKLQQAVGELEKAAAEAAAPQAPGEKPVSVQAPNMNIRGALWSGSLGIVAGLGELVMILFLVYFILACGDLFKRKLMKIVGRSGSKVTEEILDGINTNIEHYLVVLVITGSVVGVVSWLAFWAVGLQQPAVWGIAAGVLNTIPYFGPFLVAAGVAVVAVLQFGTVAKAALLVALSIVITSLEGNLLVPLLASLAGLMNPVAVFIGLLFWGWVWGVWGLLLAVPMLMVVKVVCDHIEELNAIGELLGD